MRHKAGLRLLIQGIDRIVNFTVLVIFLLLFCYGCYGMWDSHQIYQQAEASNYEIYKPTEDNALSFEQFKQKNTDVFGWLTVYGTNIDYPIVQADDNRKYVNTDPMGEYSLSGSIFLDYRNRQDFTDFNSILYGHHMEKSAMFGDIGKYDDPEYFEQHEYGNLYHDGKDYGIHFWAFIEVNAYDSEVYAPALTEDNAQMAYLQMIREQSKNIRELEVSPEDRIVLLTTCASEATDGRHILVGKITDETYQDSFAEGEGRVNRGEGIQGQTIEDFLKGIPIWTWGIILVFFGLLVISIILKVRGYNKARKEGITDEKNKK